MSSFCVALLYLLLHMAMLLMRACSSCLIGYMVLRVCAVQRCVAALRLPGLAMETWQH